MTRGTVAFERQTPELGTFSNVVTVLAAVFGSVLTVAFQTGFLPCFQPLFVHSPAWPPIYYGFWGCSISLALVACTTRADIRRDVAPIAIFCIVAAGLCLLHPLDEVSKNLIVALALASCLTVFSLVCGLHLMMRLCASVTALNAVICLLDLLFTSTGRAIDFNFNPNITAAALLLGGVANYKVISQRLRIPFLILVGGAIFATLARSTLLIAGLLVAGAASVSLVRRVFAIQADKAGRQMQRIDLLAFCALMCWMLTVAVVNPRFFTSAAVTYSGLTDASGAFQSTIEELEARREVPSVTGVSAPPVPTRAEILALGADATKPGDVNSAAVRALLLERGYLAFKSGPFWGRGLKIAHDLAPHNTYLLFAIAFGWAGLAVPLALILLALYKVREPADLGLAISIAGIMIFSHDLLVPGLLIPLVIGIVPLPSKKHSPEIPGAANLAVRAVTVIAFLFLALGSIAVATIASATVSLNPLRIGIINSHAYSSFLVLEYHGLIRPAYSTDSGSSTAKYEMQENGVAISNSISSIREVLDIGYGRFALSEHDVVVFSASDNSDPRQNLRSYRIIVPVSLNPFMILVLIATLLWCLEFVAGTGRVLATSGTRLHLWLAGKLPADN